MSEPGARLSVTDVLVLALAGFGTARLHGAVGEFAWGIPVVVGHFFLFCNLVRVRTRDELAWCALFLANVFLQGSGGWPGWGQVLLVQLPVTALVVLKTWHREDYRGVFYQRHPRWRAASPGA